MDDKGRADEQDYDGSRSDWLFERLRDDILDGVLAPEQKLSEPKIAQRYGVSRGPIREAIRRLEERGLVSRSPRTGARAATLSREDVADLIMIRENLEALAAKLAARNMTEEDMRNLRAIVTQRISDLRSGVRSEYVFDHLDFHSAIAKGSGSAELERLLCRDYFYRFRLLYQRAGWTPSVALEGQLEHERIVEAIERRDEDLAELLMRRHITFGMKRYLM
jgi:DNA-binding GntR family transcriptional regulator